VALSLRCWFNCGMSSLGGMTKMLALLVVAVVVVAVGGGVWHAGANFKICWPQMAKV